MALRKISLGTDSFPVVLLVNPAKWSMRIKSQRKSETDLMWIEIGIKYDNGVRTLHIIQSGIYIFEFPRRTNKLMPTP